MHFHWGTISVPTILFEVLTSSPTWNDYDAGISFWTFSSGFSSALLVTFLSLEQFQFPYDSASSIWINTVFFPLSVLDWPFIFLFIFFSKTNLKAFPSEGKTFKTLHCIFYPTILDWCVMSHHFRLTLESLHCPSPQASENEGLCWTRSTGMQREGYRTGFLEALQHILPMNRDMKAFKLFLQTKWDINYSMYKRFKDKIPGMWPKSWKHLCCWFPLDKFGINAWCVWFNLLFVSSYECWKLAAIINPSGIFQLKRYLPFASCATHGRVVLKPQITHSYHCS